MMVDLAPHATSIPSVRDGVVQSAKFNWLEATSGAYPAEDHADLAEQERPQVQVKLNELF